MSKHLIKINILKSSTLLLLTVFWMVNLSAVRTASAVTYQTGVGVSFTFNPKLTLTLSSSNLVISNLAPGTSDNSNEIAITVSTNAAYGYNLSATVGNSTNYNNRDLTHTSGSSAGKFSSIAFQSSPSNYTSSFTTDNTWGYSIDSGTKYNGLPLYSDTTNIATLKSTDTTPATGTDTVNFLIGAKASTTQPTGDYKNVINFIAVTNPVPEPVTIATATYLQDVNSCPAELPEEQVYTLKDKRDEQEYKVAKLKDGKCWMVENLNIAGGTALSSEDTDFDSSYTLPTTGRWTVVDGKLVLPASATKNPDNNNLTDSTQFDTYSEYAYVFNSGNKENCGASGQTIPCYSYYSWDTATLGSGRTIATDNTDAPYSICPKNWRLPTSGSTSNNGWKRGDFYTLATNYGANLETQAVDSASSTSGNFYINAGPNTIPSFIFTGFYTNGHLSNVSDDGFYWSSTNSAIEPDRHHVLFSYFHVNIFGSSSNFPAGFGASVRCLYKE